MGEYWCHYRIQKFMFKIIMIQIYEKEITHLQKHLCVRFGCLREQKHPYLHFSS